MLIDCQPGYMIKDSIACGAVPGFKHETDQQVNNLCAGSIMFTDKTPCVGRGYKSDLRQSCGLKQCIGLKYFLSHNGEEF